MGHNEVSSIMSGWGDLPNDVRTHYKASGGYEILKKLLLLENFRSNSMRVANKV